MHTRHTTDHRCGRRIGLGNPRWRQTIVALATVTFGIVATACGSDTEAGSAAADESAAATDNAPAATDTPTIASDPAPTTEPLPAEPEPAASDVVIDVVVDISTDPGVGEFVVSDGGDALGCDGGRFYLSADDDNLFSMTCETGSNRGEFQMLIDPTIDADENVTGTWTIVSGTGDFETLSGGGELDGVRDIPTASIIETHTGEIQFAATDG
jgi:hypothetical protein